MPPSPAEAALNTQLKEALNALPQQIAIVDKDARITYVNKVWEQAADNPTPLYAELGTDYLNICQDAQPDVESREAVEPDHIYRGLWDILEGVSDQFVLEYSCPTESGQRWFVMYIKPFGTEGAVISHIDVTRHRRHEQEMERVAYTDALTGLPNRRAFFERAKQMIALAKRHARELHLLYIDLDDFKRVNDSLGHDAGDTLLIKVTGRFKRQVRESDLLARLGGDEFACLLEVFHDDDPAQIIARYAACLDLPFRLASEEVRIGASIGVAQFPQDGSTLRTLLKGADSKMYENKRRSENRVAKVSTQRQWTEGSGPS